TRSIGVEARGEVAELKDNINQMIANLRDTTQKNTEQDWLKTNLAKFTRMLQGQREMVGVAKLILHELSPLVSAQHGVFYISEKAVIELASFNPFTDIHLAFLDQLTEGIGIVLNTISAGMRTEELLKQSQSLAEELQSQQEELKEKNARLEQQTATLRDSEEL